jgi:hypothetical protein
MLLLRSIGVWLIFILAEAARIRGLLADEHQPA